MVQPSLIQNHREFIRASPIKPHQKIATLTPPLPLPLPPASLPFHLHQTFFILHSIPHLLYSSLPPPPLHRNSPASQPLSLAYLSVYHKMPNPNNQKFNRNLVNQRGASSGSNKYASIAYTLAHLTLVLITSLSLLSIHSREIQY